MTTSDEIGSPQTGGSRYAPDLMGGQVALVVGGRSGLGLATAKALHAVGATVVIASRDLDACAEAAASIDPTGETATALAVDVRDPAQCEKIVADVLSDHGRLDVLVSSAGGGFVADIENVSHNGFAAIVSLNLQGAFDITRAAFEPMRERGRGTIVHVVSPVLDRPMPGLVHIGAAKAGLIHLVRGWAVEWAHFGIRVNAVAPGIFFTEGARDAIVGDEKYASLVDDIPLGRHGTPGEFADAVVFLSSDAGSYVTGQCLYVDAGMFLAKGVSYRKEAWS